jgi:hypothetical protein
MTSSADDIPFEEYYTAEDLADAASILYGATHTNGARPDLAAESWQPLKASAFLELPEPEGNELLGPLVLRGGRTIVGGDSGHGKTTLTYAMLSAIVYGTELLKWQGSGMGPALIIDLEQGIRSIKRGLRESELDDNVYVLNLPDGLALDQNPGELLRLEEVIVTIEPTVISIDPYYKAHRGDANEERAVTDLMRNLDRLRSEYGFALLLPAHVRKEVQASGARKLTLGDIAGSGAISRGAEVVIGLERLSHGTARLRFLKDREGDLPVGDFLELNYSQEDGFTIDEERSSSQSIEGAIMAVEQSGWMTAKEWKTTIGFRESETRRVLERLAAAHKIAFAIGPQGRSGTAKCYSTRVDPQLIPDDRITPDHPGSPGADGVGDPGDPNHPRRGWDPGSPSSPRKGDPRISSEDDIDLEPKC